MSCEGQGWGLHMVLLASTGSSQAQHTAGTGGLLGSQPGLMPFLPSSPDNIFLSQPPRKLLLLPAAEGPAPHRQSDPGAASAEPQGLRPPGHGPGRQGQ